MGTTRPCTTPGSRTRSGRGPDPGEHHGHDEAAALSRTGDGLAAVGPRDRAHYGHAQAGPLRGYHAIGAEAAERLEEARDVVGRYDRAAVAHLDLDLTVHAAAAGYAYEAARQVVPDPVLHKVLHQPFQQHRIACGEGRVRPL